jgi:hypothetical protein
VHCAKPDDGARQWRSQEGIHLDLRGLDPPEPLVTVLRLIDSGEAETVIIAHFDREPIFLYPELDDRGWTHEMIASSCGGSHCGDDVALRLVRLGP